MRPAHSTWVSPVWLLDYRACFPASWMSYLERHVSEGVSDTNKPKYMRLPRKLPLQVPRGHDANPPVDESYTSTVFGAPLLLPHSRLILEPSIASRVFGSSIDTSSGCPAEPWDEAYFGPPQSYSRDSSIAGTLTPKSTVNRMGGGRKSLGALWVVAAKLHGMDASDDIFRLLMDGIHLSENVKHGYA